MLENIPEQEMTHGQEVQRSISRGWHLMLQEMTHRKIKVPEHEVSLSMLENVPKTGCSNCSDCYGSGSSSRESSRGLCELEPVPSAATAVTTATLAITVDYCRQTGGFYRFKHPFTMVNAC